jgi:hypothetical protein
MMARRPSTVVALAAATALLLLLVAAGTSDAAGILPPRHVAPDFTARAVVGGEIQNLSLSKDLLKGKDGWAVLLFYPLDFTFVCP